MSIHLMRLYVSLNLFDFIVIIDVFRVFLTIGQCRLSAELPIISLHQLKLIYSRMKAET